MPEEQEPRVASLHALMRDIGALRRQVETDLTLTAAALEHAELEVADDLLAGSLRHLDAFDRDAQLHLGTREPAPANVTALRPSRRRRAGLREAAVAASVAAAAAVAFVVLPGSSPTGTVLQAGALPADQQVAVDEGAYADQTVSPAPVDQFAQATVELTQLASTPRPRPAEIKQVSEQLATQVQALRGTQMASDPDTVSRALAALAVERDLLRDHDANGSLTTLLVRNRQLTATLNGVLNTLTGTVAGVVGASPAPTVRPSLSAPANPLAPRDQTATSPRLVRD